MDIAQDEPEKPQVKKISCDLCRKRKLKCDGVRGGCSTCTKLGKPCVYNEVRRKSGPKRGYVKTLEARIGTSLSDDYRTFHADALQAQMETKLKTSSTAADTNVSPQSDTLDMDTSPPPYIQAAANVTSGIATNNDTFTSQNQPPLNDTLPMGTEFQDPLLFAQNFNTNFAAGAIPVDNMPLGTTPSADNFFTPFNFRLQPSYDNAVIALGLEEAMPDRDVIDDL